MSGFEDSAGLGVNNHYGPRDAGGTEGVVRTDGTNNEFMIDKDSQQLDFGFPATDGSAYVTLVDHTVSNGTTFTIGGVDVSAATDAAPVNIPADNTGVIVTDATTGKVLVTYNKYAL
jgi:hypothetical protein